MDYYYYISILASLREWTPIILQPEKGFWHPQSQNSLAEDPSSSSGRSFNLATPTIIGFEPRTPCVLPEWTNTNKSSPGDQREYLGTLVP